MSRRALEAGGFSSREADRLVTLKRQYDRGAFRELSEAQKRLLFARWLVEQARLSDGQPRISTSIVDDERGLTAREAAVRRRAAA